MPCYKPLKAFKAPGGRVKFSRSGAYRDLPLTLPCGQCSGCRLERSRQWAVRLMHEAQMHDQNCFITLTYDDEHLPSDGSINVKHWQDFAKRFRKTLGRLRFYHCGEYGDRNGRPHYHAAIFGHDFRADRIFDKNSKTGFPLYTSEALANLWPAGQHWIGELTFESAAYIARYIMKKITGDQAGDRYGENINKATGEVTLRRKPEYTTMSRRPGIGKAWITKFMSDVYPSDQVITNGKPCRPPKFYDREYEKINPQGWRKVRVRRELDAAKHEENNTYWRLEVRETVKKAQMQHFRRE